VNFPITDFIMTYESTIVLHVLLIFGIVYLTMLSMLILLTILKIRLDRFWANPRC